MLAELLIVNSISNGNKIASLEVPSSERDDSTVFCGHVEVLPRHGPPDSVNVYISSAFSKELELDGQLTNDELQAEEDLLIQAVMLELPRLLATPLAEEVTFNLTTPRGKRTVTLPSHRSTGR